MQLPLFLENIVAIIKISIEYDTEKDCIEPLITFLESFNTHSEVQRELTFDNFWELCSFEVVTLLVLLLTNNTAINPALGNDYDSLLQTPYAQIVQLNAR